MRAVGIVGGEANLTNVDLVHRWQGFGIDACLLTPAEARAELVRGDLAIARLDVLPTLDGIEDGLLELLELEAHGVRVLNGVRALLNAHDKLRTARRLAAAGVPHVETQHVRTRAAVAVDPPLVVKPRFGSWGIDVIRCDDEASVDATFASIAERGWFVRHGAVVQPLVAPMGRDLRVLVACGRVVGGESRVSARGEWRTNISLGGTHLPVDVWATPSEIAVAAAAAVGGDFMGVDLLPTFGGYLVLEVNAAVEFDSTYSFDSDVFADAAEALGLVGEPDAVSAAAG